MSKNLTIEALKAGDQKTYARLYTAYKKDFINLVFQLTYSGRPLDFEHSKFGNPSRRGTMLCLW